ncbi:hypothetical protein ABLE93_13180 [Xanthobacter sp. KR7-65]|uniref:hypothetical protein n=1 Tax=Xanthobacter sp. KR7-65 TaxID=3156612 RepID=UPI0032B55AD2
MNLARLKESRRLLHPSTWRWFLLTATNGAYAPLFQSLAVSNRDRFKDPVPWFAWHSFPVLAEEVKARTGGKLLEWGSGASTAYYVSNGLKVTAFEHIPGWADMLRDALKAKGLEADIRVTAPEAYARPDLDPGEFSIFVIDGRERSACAGWLAEAIQAGRVGPGTLIIFDDSQRPRYAEAIALLARLCKRQATYTGPTSLDLDKATTFFWV